MSIFDIISMCLRNLWKRKLRTLLTMLGVIIGTAALILTISLGLANEARFDRMVAEWERDLTVINVHAATWGWFNPETEEWEDSGGSELNDAAIASIRVMPGVRAVAPFMQGSTIFLRSGAYSADIWNVVGTTADGLESLDRELAWGRLPNEDDPFGTVVLGANVELRFELFGAGWQDWANRDQLIWQGVAREDIEQFVDVTRDPINFSYDRRFTLGGGMGFEDAFRPIRSFPLNVVGVFEHSGQMWWDSIDNSVYIDIETLQQLAIFSADAQREQEQEWWGVFTPIPQDPREAYDNAMVWVHDVRDTGDVAAEIRLMGFNAWFEADWILRAQEAQQGTAALLVAIAAVSIFVAAISIANTMIMAVYERTREIGVMKVIGGAISDIRRMFLLEAALIGLFGGILGVGLSLAGSYAMNNTTIEALVNMGFGSTVEGDVTSLVTLWLMGVALLFASAIGLVSGYFPARRATKLSALEAIRTD